MSDIIPDPDPSLLPDEPVDKLQSSTYIESAMRRARTDVNTWVYQERTRYADKKWDSKTHDPLIRALRDDPHQESEGRQYLDWIQDYFLRMKQFGLDTPQGRQAAGKALVTLHHMLESAVVAFGRMPNPGHPSGEIQYGKLD